MFELAVKWAFRWVSPISFVRRLDVSPFEIADVQDESNGFPGKDSFLFRKMYNGHFLIEEMMTQRPFHRHFKLYDLKIKLSRFSI